MKIFNKAAWGLVTIFFAIAFVVLLIAEPIVVENETNINYAFNINPWEQITDKGEGDIEYFKSDYVKKNADGSVQYVTESNGYKHQVYDDVAMRAGSMRVSEEAAADGAVLLWNENNALPLTAGNKISFFGVSCKPNNWLYTGHGSGNVSVTTTDFPDLKTAFEAEGKFSVNPTLWNSYSNTRAYQILSNPNGDDNHYREFTVNEKAWSSVNSAAGSSFSEYGDAAVYFISRTGAEDGDTWFDTSVNTNDGHIDNNYLDLTANEKQTIEELIALKKRNVFQKVILVLNTGTPLQMKTVSAYDIDSCLWVGMGGNASFAAVYDVMSGKVNPSGRLVDTYAYNNDSAPSTVNTGAFEFTGSTSGLPAENRSNNSYNHAYIVYQEGIYVGYRYYETRYEDTVMGTAGASSSAGVVNGSGAWKYKDEVLYPFGYGLSYTSFAYSDFSVQRNGDDYVVTVKVTNTGLVAGKTPVQVYLQKPYTDYDKQHGIEKASVELVGYTKTDLLQSGESKEYSVTVAGYEFKTYDSYNQKTYILEEGDYYLSFGENAHEALNNILAAKGYGANDGMTDTYGNATSGNEKFAYKEHISSTDISKYAVSPFTGKPVTNQFDDTDINLYKGTSDQTITYLSRSDWSGTYPVAAVVMRARNRTFVADMQYSSDVAEDPAATVPTYGTVTSQTGELKLIMLKGLDYDNPFWENLLDQLTWEETVTLCGVGSHIINAVNSVGSPAVVAQDGPAGVKVSTTQEISTFMAFPNGVLLASTWDDALVERVGQAFGLEMLHSGCGEIYGTGAGIHRSAYGGRNWEYFSEDGFITGKMLAAEVKGLQSKGAIVNIKHLVLNDQEIYRCGTTTWANEQSIREIYLKAFEAGITEGHANGVMSSLNRLGCTWVGRHYGLLTEVLRNEWGFVGLVETDAATGIYMREGAARANAVIAGNDLWLRGNKTDAELWGDFKNSPTVCTALRESAHRILYTVCNSAAMNGVDSSTRFVYVRPWYYGLLHAGQIIVGIVTAAAVLMTVACFVLPFMKEKRDKKPENVK